MKKVIIAFVCFLILAIIGVSSIGYFWYYPKFIKPVQAYVAASSEMKDFKTSEFELNMYYTMETELEGMPSQDIDMEITMNGDGKIDVDAQQLEMNLKISMPGISVEMEEVVDGDVIYIKVPPSDDFEKYTKEELIEQFGGSNTVTAENFKNNQIWGDLADDVEYEYVGEVEVGGEKQYHYEVKVSEGDISKFTDNFVNGFNLGSGGAFNVSEDDVKIEGLNFEVWVDKGTSNPTREKLTIDSIEIYIDGLGTFYVNDMVIEVEYEKVNEPVDIVVPEV